MRGLRIQARGIERCARRRRRHRAARVEKATRGRFIFIRVFVSLFLLFILLILILILSLGSIDRRASMVLSALHFRKRCRKHSVRYLRSLAFFCARIESVAQKWCLDCNSRDGASCTHLDGSPALSVRARADHLFLFFIVVVFTDFFAIFEPTLFGCAS